MGGRTIWNSEGKGGLTILEFPKARGGLDEDAARGRVWIFSGITHCSKSFVLKCKFKPFVIRFLDRSDMQMPV